MTRCENKDVCCYFQDTIKDDTILREDIMSIYCNSNKDKCARYKVKARIMKGYSLPDDYVLDEIGRLLSDLKPEDIATANSIISKMVH